MSHQPVCCDTAEVYLRLPARHTEALFGRAVQPGEDIRAGRWWWENPETKECGLHVKEHDAHEHRAQ